jgi:hypothetical protein
MNLINRKNRKKKEDKRNGRLTRGTDRLDIANRVGAKYASSD